MSPRLTDPCFWTVIMSAKSDKATQATPRPDLGKLYKPVGINAVSAAALCKKGVGKPTTRGPK